MSEHGGPHEYELKAVLTVDLDRFREQLEKAGWRRLFHGSMRDRRYDTPGRTLESQDEVVRLRRYESDDGTVRYVLAWKGPVSTSDGLKVREEIETEVADGEKARAILARLGLTEVIGAIDRVVESYETEGATVRIEVYPHMDVLVELEGEPEELPRRIAELGLPREAWLPWQLPEFVEAFERRTGEEARLSWTTG